MKRIMRAFKIAEISGVDKPAQAHARAVIMKRNEPFSVTWSEEARRNLGRMISEEVDAMNKRTFSAGERRRDARSGAAESDGSFPIENATDLHNAMRAVGRSKNPAKTKAHIRARARALGLTSQLSDAFKSEGNGLMKFLGLIKGFGVNADALSESLKSIVDDKDAADKGALIDETIKQFSEEVEKDLAETLAGQHPETANDEDQMSAALKKALGLADTASEEDIIAAVAKRDEDLAKAKADAEALAKSAHEAEMAKAVAEKEELAKAVAELKEEREVAKFEAMAKRNGLPASKGALLRNVLKGDNAALDEVLTFIKSAVAAAEMGEVFKEIGSSNAESSDDPMVMLKAKAAELRKADPKLSEQQAFARVYTDPAYAALAKAERRKNGVA